MTDKSAPNSRERQSAAYTFALAERTRDIAEGIVDTRTEEGQTLLNAAAELERLRSSLGWLRDYAEGHEQYHTGFKHMRRYIEATDA